MHIVIVFWVISFLNYLIFFVCIKLNIIVFLPLQYWLTPLHSNFITNNNPQPQNIVLKEINNARCRNRNFALVSSIIWKGQFQKRQSEFLLKLGLAPYRESGRDKSTCVAWAAKSSWLGSYHFFFLHNGCHNSDNYNYFYP